MVREKSNRQISLPDLSRNRATVTAKGSRKRTEVVNRRVNEMIRHGSCIISWAAAGEVPPLEAVVHAGPSKQGFIQLQPANTTHSQIRRGDNNGCSGRSDAASSSSRGSRESATTYSAHRSRKSVTACCQSPPQHFHCGFPCPARLTKPTSASDSSRKASNPDAKSCRNLKNPGERTACARSVLCVAGEPHCPPHTSEAKDERRSQSSPRHPADAATLFGSAKE